MWHQCQLAITLLAISGACAAKTAGIDNSGISQFWTDDYKVFDKIYGRTSDKGLFGATLPPGFSYGVDLTHQGSQATEKKERYLDNESSNSYLNDDHIDPFAYGHKFQLTNQLKGLNLKGFSTKKPTKSFQFISTEFKPISQKTDPETYKYLKHLEKLQKEKTEFPEAAVGGFKPYLSYGGIDNTNPEETDAYKSIQEILDAHEGNKGKKETFVQDDVKYYGPSKGRPKPKGGKKPKSRPPLHKSGVRYRKRNTNSYRIRKVPYVRKIKKVITY